MKLKGILAVIFLSFLSSSTVIAASPEQGATTYRNLVIYYGWYSDSRSELSAQPCEIGHGLVTKYN